MSKIVGLFLAAIAILVGGVLLGGWLSHNGPQWLSYVVCFVTGFASIRCLIWATRRIRDRKLTAQRTQE